METANMALGHVFIKLFNGKTIVFNVLGGETVKDLKENLFNTCGIDSSFSHSLWIGLTEVEDEYSVLDLLNGEDQISLTHHIDVCGGAKKRKKKQYTTPKKIKHKKRKVKLAVLKFYKVEGDKVIKLLKECPAESCGSGVFMGSHHNRSYCGRCGLTYILNAQEQ